MTLSSSIERCFTEISEAASWWQQFAIQGTSLTNLIRLQANIFIRYLAVLNRISNINSETKINKPIIRQLVIFTSIYIPLNLLTAALITVMLFPNMKMGLK